MKSDIKKLTIDTIHCHVCKEKYHRIIIGNKHVHGLCAKCWRSDEIGLLFDLPKSVIEQEEEKLFKNYKKYHKVQL